MWAPVDSTQAETASLSSWSIEQQQVIIMSDFAGKTGIFAVCLIFGVSQICRIIAVIH